MANWPPWLGGPWVAEGVFTASHRKRDSGEEEELFSVASVTMATFPFVSRDPELLPPVRMGMQVRQLHDGVRKTRRGETELPGQTHVHAARY